MKFPRLFAGFAALALNLGFAASNLAQAEELNVYSARHYDTDHELYKTFEKKTGIKVKVVEAKGDQLLARLKAEGANSPADILITVDAGRLAAADNAGLFAPVKSEILEAAIPANLRHGQGHWFAFGKRFRLIVYAKDRVKPEELSTYEDLADEKWKGRVTIRSSSNIYNQSLIASIIATHGEEKAEAWAKGIVGNLARKPKGGDRDQVKAIAAGEGDIAVVNHYYVLQMRDSKDQVQKDAFSKVGIFFPNQGDRGTHTNISGAGVLKNAPNRAAAQKFLEFLASEQGQKLYIAGSHEMAVVAGVQTAFSQEGFHFKEDTSIAANTIGKLGATALKIADRASWP